VDENKDKKLVTRLQGPGAAIVIAMFVVSLLLHVLTAVPISYYQSRNRQLPVTKEPIKIRIVQKPKTEPTQKREDAQVVVETPQTPTERPDSARFAGAQDHKTDKETKVAETLKRPKAADPGQQGATRSPGKENKLADKPKEREIKKQPRMELGKIQVPNERKPRNNYESMLPLGSADLSGAMKAGYQDYINEDLALGDRVDINTTEYRYIGYFTNMRKAIELVWTYPIEATQLGMQGEVQLEFVIEKTGKASRIKVLKSSGYKLLDDAIVEAIRLASPFSPLPEGFGKNRLLVAGAFRYVLTGFGGH
jgi:TonB family protein